MFLGAWMPFCNKVKPLWVTIYSFTNFYVHKIFVFVRLFILRNLLKFLKQMAMTKVTKHICPPIPLKHTLKYHLKEPKQCCACTITCPTFFCFVLFLFQFLFVCLFVCLFFSFLNKIWFLWKTWFHFLYACKTRVNQEKKKPNMQFERHRWTNGLWTKQDIHAYIHRFVFF